jgi:hypothetical protein
MTPSLESLALVKVRQIFPNLQRYGFRTGTLFPARSRTSMRPNTKSAGRKN